MDKTTETIYDGYPKSLIKFIEWERGRPSSIEVYELFQTIPVFKIWIR